ncbi:hypothetical protein EDC04DRAFT_2600260 [Pisolithus marmoratus]|nr:hypothetical protein EDC04DRAFT_2600260 [Pisolithus marmoratus]
MLATKNVTVTELWATTFMPTSPSVSALVMLIAPQHCAWFLIKSPIINFMWSLQPTPVKHNQCMFALTWANWVNAMQFSTEGRIFLLAFHDSAMFWCFKYMVHCHDYVDHNWHHTPELNAKILLDAFLNFKIPAEVPLGVRGGVTAYVSFTEYTPLQSPASKGGNSHEDANGRLDLPQSQSTAVDDSTGGTGECIPRPIDPDICPIIDMLLATFNSLHTPQSQSITMGDNAGGTSEPNPDLIILEDQAAADALLSLSATDQGASQLTVIRQCHSLLLAPINLGEGSPDCDVIGHQKKRKLI